MEKYHIFVYEPTYYEVGLRADEIYEFLLNKGLNVSLTPHTNLNPTSTLIKLMEEYWRHLKEQYTIT